MKALKKCTSVLNSLLAAFLALGLGTRGAAALDAWDSPGYGDAALQTDDKVERLKGEFLRAKADQQVQIARELGIACFDAGQLSEAFYYLFFYASSAKNSTDADDVLSLLAEVEPELKASLCRLEIRAPQTGALICETWGHKTCYRPPFAKYYKSGRVKLNVRAPGYESKEFDFELSVGIPTTRLALLELVSEERPPEIAGSVGRTEWPWVVGGAGLAVLCVASILEFVAFDRYDEMDSREDILRSYPGLGLHEAAKAANRDFMDEVRPLNYAAGSLFVIGGAALATGVVWYLLEDVRGGTPVVAPVVNSELTGFQVQLEF